MNIHHLIDQQSLPQPTTLPVESAIYKSTPHDFIVKEVMDIDFTNTGEHLWLNIEKSGMNTTHLASLLAKWAKIPQRDVGYSGIKDRHAVTTQWFSLRIPKKQQPSEDFFYHDESNHESAKILQHYWHNKKLNRGTHKYNYFRLILREVVGDKLNIESQLKRIQQQGIPNYFGEQRFGHNGNNIKSALEWFEKEPVKHNNPNNKKNRDKQSILLSAARSIIFNQILAKRVIDGSWNTGLDGEIFNLAGTGSVFATESLDSSLRTRLESHDIHATGTMWGQTNQNSAKPSGKALQLEKLVIEENVILSQLAKGLENKEIKASRRPLRLTINELSWNWQDNNSTLELTFVLPAGSYATCVLQALVNNPVSPK